MKGEEQQAVSFAGQQTGFFTLEAVVLELFRAVCETLSAEEDVRGMILASLADYGPAAKNWALNFGSIALEKSLGASN